MVGAYATCRRLSTYPVSLVCSEPQPMSNSQPPDAPAAKPPHDSAATKRRLLLAATHEFTERGIAGARVDRIALAARSNKRLIYDYFVDKDGLFDAVMDAHIDLIIEAVPIDAADLPGYPGPLFTYSPNHPTLVLLLTCPRREHRPASATPPRQV